MPCERTKRQRIRWKAARPSEVRSPSARNIIRANPEEERSE